MTTSVRQPVRLISVCTQALWRRTVRRSHEINLAGVRDAFLTGSDVRLPGDRFELVYDREMRVYQDREDAGRAFWLGRASGTKWSLGHGGRSAVGEERWKPAAFNPRVTVVLDKHPPFASSAGRRERRVADGRPRAHSAEGRDPVDAKTAGLLVLSDTYYPGWEADLDGKPVEILRANGVMRAVAVPTGTHTVRFRYEPRSLQLGAAVSLSCLAGALGVALFARTATV